MLANYLIQEILDLQEKNQVNEEKKFSQEQLEEMPESRLRELKYRHIGFYLGHMHFTD